MKKILISLTSLVALLLCIPVPAAAAPLSFSAIADDGDSTRSLELRGAYYLHQVNASLAVISANSAVASNTFRNITTASTTVVKSGTGTLHSVTINALGTVASLVTIYDSATGSGTKIASINSLSISGTLTYDVSFSNGVTIVTTGTVAPDITVSYR